MSSPDPQSLSIVLYGLDDRLALQLTQATAGPGRTLDRATSLRQFTRACSRGEVDVVFASAERAKYLELLQVLRSNRIQLPVIVASRLPEDQEWLDALDAGAADYCALPFERCHIQWILESILRSNPAHGRFAKRSGLKSAARPFYSTPAGENFNGTPLA